MAVQLYPQIVFQAQSIQCQVFPVIIFKNQSLIVVIILYFFTAFKSGHWPSPHSVTDLLYSPNGSHNNTILTHPVTANGTACISNNTTSNITVNSSSAESNELQMAVQRAKNYYACFIQAQQNAGNGTASHLDSNSNSISTSAVSHYHHHHYHHHHQNISQ